MAREDVMPQHLSKDYDDIIVGLERLNYLVDMNTRIIKFIYWARK